MDKKSELSNWLYKKLPIKVNNPQGYATVYKDGFNFHSWNPETKVDFFTVYTIDVCLASSIGKSLPIAFSSKDLAHSFLTKLIPFLDTSYQESSGWSMAYRTIYHIRNLQHPQVDLTIQSSYLSMKQISSLHMPIGEERIDALLSTHATFIDSEVTNLLYHYQNGWRVD